MVRMTDLLKKAKQQMGAKREEPRIEEERRPVPAQEPPKQKEVPVRPPAPEKEKPAAPSLPEKKAPEAAKPEEKAPVPEREIPKPAVPTPPAPEPEKARAPEKEMPYAEKREARENVEFSGMLGRTEQAHGKEDIAHRLMRASFPDDKETRQLYFEALEFTKRLFASYKNKARPEKEEVNSMTNKIVNNIMLGSQGLLKLFHELDVVKDYIYHNAVNVSILSVNMGIVYKYNKSALLDLAVVGLLHDMDLIKSEHIVKKSGKLDEKELAEIRKHPLSVATFADTAFNLKDSAVKAILQHHERRNGGGYPNGLIDEDIHDLAVIVGIADTYESITHSRSYKEKLSPHMAIMNIINIGKDLFPNEAVKALVTCVGLYPVDSWVELNTGDAGKVIMTNPESPLRPVVSVIMDKEGHKFREVRTVDLRKVPSLYIKRGIEKLQEK